MHAVDPVRERDDHQIRPRGSNRAPLSFAQQRFWFFDRFAPRTAVYNMPIVTRLTGAVDIAALERSLQRLIGRHEILRTRVAMNEDEAVQVVEPLCPVSLEVIDVSGADDGEQQAAAWLDLEVRRPFDLSSLPLLRAHVVRTGAEDHILALVGHHFILDAWSIGILRRELMALYDAECNGCAVKLPPLPVQYGDYAVWQREWMCGAVHDRQLAYWKAQLAGLATLDLPTDRQRPTVQSFRGSTLPFELSEELTAELRRLSLRHGATLSMTLLAALQLLLARYSGQSDIGVGSPIVNRNRTEVEDVIGPFLNMVVLRSDVREGESFSELLHRVRGTALDAYANQDLPFERVVEEVQPARDSGRTPLFQVMFVFQPDTAIRLSSLRARPMLVNLGGARFDLTVQVSDASGRLRGLFEYNTDLFDGWRIQQIATHYARVLGAVVANPDRPIACVPLLTPREERSLIDAGSGSSSNAPVEGVMRRIEAQAVSRPAGLAVVAGDEQLTYEALNARANQVARYLVARGVQAGDTVAMVLPRSTDLIVSVLALLKTGAVVLAMDPNEPADRLAHMLREVGPQLVLTTADVARALPVGPPLTILDAPEVSAAVGMAPATSCEATGLTSMRGDKPVAVTYTSGVASEPRAVVITQDGMRHALTALEAMAPLTSADRVASIASIGANRALSELLWPLTAGATLVIASDDERLHPALVARIIERQRITVLPTTARLARAIARHSCESTSSPRLIVAGDAAAADDAERWHRCAREVVQAYGTAETAGWVTATSVPRDARSSAVVGRPLGSARIYVLDSRLRPVPIGVSGDVYVAATGALGYCRQPAATAESFVAAPFGAPGSRMCRTGDRARWTVDGALQFVSRSHDRTTHADLTATEDALRACPDVADAVVVLHEGAEGTRCVAYVLARPNASLDPDRLRRQLVGKVAPALVPTAIVRLDDIPLAMNGTVDRRGLPAPVFDAKPDDTGTTARTEAERLLAGIWADLLGRAEIGLHDNFFEIGGHSLMATRVILRIERAFGVSLTLGDLFDAVTVAELSSLIEQKAVEGA
jgi:amino acid adenylation domain-containing protein